MKKTDTLIKIVSVLVFCAMAAYLAFYIAERVLDPVQTALTVTATMTDSSAMSGLVVRDELLVSSSAQYIDVTAREGEKLAAGEAVAVAYGSEEALERASRLSALGREIEDIKALMEDGGGLRTVQDRDSSIHSALAGLSAAVQSQALSGIDTEANALASLIFRAGSTDATEAYLQTLEEDYAALAATASGTTEQITVAQGGTFSSVVDGYEGVSPEYARELTPAQLREIIASKQAVKPDTVGKLITSFFWYYAAIVDRGDASRLAEGMTVQLSFGRYCSDYLAAEVAFLGRAEGAEQVVVFRMDKGFADMLAVRAVSAELIYSEYTGLRVPLKALYRYYAGYMTDEGGERLTEGETVTLTLGDTSYEAVVSEVGPAQHYGELPPEVEAGSEADTRPLRRQVVFCWPWADEPAPDLSAGSGTVTLAEEGAAPMQVTSFYDYDPEADRMCVFTMTGLQAERKKVELIYAGGEYGLVSSQGDDALREGNEIIVRAQNLHSGKVFH